MFGILNIFKPTGMSSRACVDRIASIARPLKVGHAGTLDPIAEGVLLVAVGQAVRLVNWLHELPKCYVARFELGKSSDSGDTETEVRSIDQPLPSFDQLNGLLPQFLGTITQTPPTYSAVHVDGQRAYHWARAETAITMPTRQVTVHSLSIASSQDASFTLEVECETGTYVRSLGRDLARMAGSDAVMSHLQRTSIGPCLMKDAAEWLAIEKKSQIQELLINPVTLIDRFRVVLSDDECRQVRHGVYVRLEDDRFLAPTAFGTSHRPFCDEACAVDQAGRLRSILTRRSDGSWGGARNFDPTP